VRTPALVVVAKSPRPGRSKTRLCPPCTPGEAAALAEAALVDTLAAAGRSRTGRRILLLEGNPGPWLPPGFEIIPQRGGGLDERLAAGVEDVGESAVLVGMDTPQVTPGLLDRALAALEEPETDAVLGPAEDGGYWAIGLRRPDPRTIAGVPMSTPFTWAAQRARLQRLGLRVRDLPVLRDADGIEDAVAVARAAPGSRFAATLAAVLGGEG
jgi:uncharacterized protein